MFLTLNSLGFFLCRIEIFLVVYHVSLHDLLGVTFLDIVIGFVIRMFRSLEYMECDLISLNSQFKLTLLHVNLSFSYSQEGSTKYDGDLIIFFHV